MKDLFELIVSKGSIHHDREKHTEHKSSYFDGPRSEEKSWFSILSSFVSSVYPAHGMILLPLRMDPLHLVNSFWTHPHVISTGMPHQSPISSKSNEDDEGKQPSQTISYPLNIKTISF